MAQSCQINRILPIRGQPLVVALTIDEGATRFEKQAKQEKALQDFWLYTVHSYIYLHFSIVYIQKTKEELE
jgi:hypothetical protein